MQTATIVINIVLSVIGLVCIHLKTYTKENHIANTVKQIVGGTQWDGSLVLTK